MNPKNTVLLLLVTAALFGFIFVFERHLHHAEPGVEKVLPDFKAAEVTSVQVLLARQPEIRVERTNDGWRLVKPLAYPADSAAVTDLLQAVLELSPQTEISAQELKSRPTMNAEYGFDNPQATLVFEQGSEQRTLKLGFLTAPGDQLYAQVVGLARVYVIDANFLKKFVPHQPNDWRDTAFVNLDGHTFDRLTVANGAQGFELRRESTNQPWHMFKPVLVRADYPKINGLLNALQQLRVTRFVTDDAGADLEAMGLQPAVLEMTFDRGTNEVLGLQFGKSPTNDSTQIYARRNGQNNIVLVPREYILPWLTGAEEFRDRHLVRLRGRLPDVIETFGPEHFIVERGESNLWRVTKPLEFPADTNVMRSFMAALAGMEVVRTDNRVAVSDTVLDSELPTYGLGSPARRYVLKRNPAMLPAGSSNATIAELDFGFSTNGNVYARRGDLPDESSVYAVKAADFENLPTNSLQLRERAIWNFTEGEVASITIRQNGKTNQLIHKGPNQWTNAVASHAIYSDLEMEVGAQELGLLAADEWVQHGDADKARYGISDRSPEIIVETKVNGKPQTQTLDIGVFPQGLRYGDVHMPDGQNWIFDFSTKTLSRLAYYFKLDDKIVP